MKGYCRKCKKLTKQKTAPQGHRCGLCGKTTSVEEIKKEVDYLNSKGTPA